MNERLYIDGNLIDIDQKELDVAISYSIEGTIPGKIQAAHSTGLVKIPATKTAQRIFENIEIPGSSPTRAYKSLPMSYQSKGLPILEGKARVDGVDLKATPTGFTPETYKVALIGTNADWFTDVGNTLVRSLNWGNLTISVADIEENVDPTTAESCFILMKWQEWIDTDRVRHEEFTPCVFVWRILQKAFQQYGYEFVSVFDSDPLNRLVIPFGLTLDPEFFQDNVNLRSSTTTPITINIVVTDPGETLLVFDDTTTAPNFDNGGNYTGGVYTSPLTALYDLIAELNVTVTATSGDPGAFNELVLVYKVNGVVVHVYDISAGHDWNTSFVFDESIIFEQIQDLNETDTVELYLKYEGVTLNASIEGVFSIQDEKENVELGEVYALSDIIPGTSFTKFIIEDLTFIFSILAEVAGHGVQHVCVTGGEPLAQRRCLALLTALCDVGYEVSLETSGALDVAPVDPRVVRVMDLKTPDSGEADRNLWSNLQVLAPQDQVQFVICSRNDYDWAREVIRREALDRRCEVLISPSHAQLDAVKLAEWMMADRLPVRFQLQLHKVLWGNRPGR